MASLRSANALHVSSQLKAIHGGIAQTLLSLDESAYPMKSSLPQRCQIRPSALYPGTPVVLMTTINPDGSTNISPLSSFWALGSRVVLGVGTDGQGGANLAAHGECVLNFPWSGQASQVEAIARATARFPVPENKRAMGYSHVSDKFSLAGFTPVSSTKVTVPAIAECPLQVEVRLLALHQPHGVVAQGFVIAEGEVHCVHAHTAIMLVGSEHIDVQRWQPLIYVFRHYLGTGKPIARNFRAET